MVTHDDPAGRDTAAARQARAWAAAYQHAYTRAITQTRRLGLADAHAIAHRQAAQLANATWKEHLEP